MADNAPRNDPTQSVSEILNSEIIEKVVADNEEMESVAQVSEHLDPNVYFENAAPVSTKQEQDNDLPMIESAEVVPVNNSEENSKPIDKYESDNMIEQPTDGEATTHTDVNSNQELSTNDEPEPMQVDECKSETINNLLDNDTTDACSTVSAENTSVMSDADSNDSKKRKLSDDSTQNSDDIVLLDQKSTPSTPQMAVKTGGRPNKYFAVKSGTRMLGSNPNITGQPLNGNALKARFRTSVTHMGRNFHVRQRTLPAFQKTDANASDDEIEFLQNVKRVHGSAKKRHDAEHEAASDSSSDEDDAPIGYGLPVDTLLDFCIVRSRGLEENDSNFRKPRVFYLVQHTGYSPMRAVWMESGTFECSDAEKNKFASAIESELDGGQRHKAYRVQLTMDKWKIEMNHTDYWTRDDANADESHRSILNNDFYSSMQQNNNRRRFMPRQDRSFI